MHTFCQIFFQYDTGLTLIFPTHTVLEHKEKKVIYNMKPFYNTLIHLKTFVLKVLDLADIVGSVGGALGLFLGFSFLATIQSLLNKMNGNKVTVPTPSNLPVT